MPQTRLSPWERQDRKDTVLSSRSNNLFELKRVLKKEVENSMCDMPPSVPAHAMPVPSPSVGIHCRPSVRHCSRH